MPESPARSWPRPAGCRRGGTAAHQRQGARDPDDHRHQPHEEPGVGGQAAWDEELPAGHGQRGVPGPPGEGLRGGEEVGEDDQYGGEPDDQDDALAQAETAQSVHGASLPRSLPALRGRGALRWARVLSRPRGPGPRPGLGGPAQETGQELQLRLVVLADDLVHGAVHPGIERQHLRDPAPLGPDQDRAPVGRVTLADDPAAPFQPVQDPGQGGRVQPGPAGQRARAQRPVPADQVEALQVGALELQVPPDLVVEQGQLHAHVAQRRPDLPVQPPAPPGRLLIGRLY